MQKLIITLCSLATLSGIAYAQTNVTIYGTVDTGLIKETGSSKRMGSNHDSYIVFSGSEDLGKGLKATFELKKQFNINDGGASDEENFADIIKANVNTGNREWNLFYKDTDWRTANVGLKGNWGAVRLGRINNISVETYRELDPFDQHGVGASLASGDLLYAEQLSNTVRYDSPNWNGFGMSASYTLGGNSKGNSDTAVYYNTIGNDGFAIGLAYDHNPTILLANYACLADSDRSCLWNLGGAYWIGSVRLSLGYQDSTTKLFEKLEGPRINQKEWFIGLEYKVGQGQLKASFNRASLEINNYKGNANKVAAGYVHNLSKRTSLYANIAYTYNDDELTGAYYNSNHAQKESVTGFQIGMTHRF